MTQKAFRPYVQFTDEEAARIEKVAPRRNGGRDFSHFVRRAVRMYLWVLDADSDIVVRRRDGSETTLKVF